MPMMPSRLCTAPGCYEPATLGSRCQRHAREHRAHAHASLSPLYQTRRWRRLSARFVRGQICLACEREGFITRATETDHVIPHHGDPALFWDETNWQPLCRRHHSQKTYTETLGRRDA
jgi:5-methylcytosine-specific restriction protein A